MGLLYFFNPLSMSIRIVPLLALSGHFDRASDAGSIHGQNAFGFEDVADVR
jgi:hypothetical protein